MKVKQIVFLAALIDLEEALKKSEYKGHIACKAYCQRGLLYRKQNNLDKAKEDFSNAAKLGSKFARTQVNLICYKLKIFNQFILFLCT